MGKFKEQIVAATNAEADFIQIRSNPGNFESLISTGSTLLDLAISGGRVRGGGIPGGILVEIYGPSGSGKTSVLAELCASTQVRGGNVKFLDPEGRLDQEYMRIYGAEMAKENYHMPNTVADVFQHIWEWSPLAAKSGSTNMIATDSLAALSTELEMSDKGDKMGMRRAKEFSEGLRKTCRLIRNSNLLIACTNQVRVGDGGIETTPGGKGVGFYASLRIRIGPPATDKYLKKEATIHGQKHQKIFGIRSVCTIKKSSIDDPFREADIFIVFGLGIDDIRGNLTYLKKATGAKTFVAVDKEFSQIAQAISHIETQQLEDALREQTISLWEQIQEQLHITRRKKRRI